MNEYYFNLILLSGVFFLFAIFIFVGSALIYYGFSYLMRLDWFVKWSINKAWRNKLKDMDEFEFFLKMHELSLLHTELYKKDKKCK